MYKDMADKLDKAIVRSIFSSLTTWTPIDRAKILHACGVHWLLCVSLIDGLEVEDIPFD